MQLETAAQISEAASSILDPGELERQVVDLIRQRFDYYYVGLFLVDESGEWTSEPGRWAVLRAGTGEPGRQMLEQGHKFEVGGTSMIGWCVANKQARIAPDMGEEAVRFDNPLLPETRFELALPLISRGQAIGALTIQSSQEVAFSEEDIAVLQTMADQLANAIANARLYDQAQKEITERKRAEEKIEHLNLVLRAIRNVNQLITRERDRDRLLQGACETLIETRGYHNAWIALLDESGGLVTTAEAGLGEDFLPIVERFKRGELTDCGRRALKQSGGVVTKDPFSTCADCPLSSMYGGRGAVTIRLEYGGKVYGLLSISIPRELAADEEEQALFEEVAGDIAFALHNVELEEEAQRRAAQAVLVYEVGQRGSSKLELDELLSEIVTAVRDAFDYYGVMLLLLDEKAERLTLQSIAGGYADIFPKDLWLAIGEGMIGYAAASGETQISGDVSQDPYYVRKADEETKSELAVPIKSGQKVVGVLDLQSDEFDAFDETDVMLMETLADQIAVAIENARLYEEIEHRLDELSLLHQVALTAISTLDFDEMLTRTIDELHGTIGFERFGYLFMDEEAQELRLHPTYYGLSADAVERIRVSLGKGVTGWVAQTGEPMLVPDVREEPRYIVFDPEVRSEMCAPLKIGDKVIGVINVESSRLNAFSEGDLRLLSTLASQLATVIENTRLYEAAQRELAERKRAEEALKEYSERLEEMVEERTQELREAQEELVRKEKLAVLGQLAGGVGHELRNPLGAIKNAAYFLNMVLEEPEPEVKETLEILEKEVGTSERIISSLLDFARAKPPMWRKVDINDTIQEALSRTVVPENVEVVSQLDEALPTILADPDQLGQAFGNIILNAIQAVPEGGRLVVKSEAPSPEWVAVSFADTGEGIPEENLGKLFEPLFTTKAKGIGLGLAVTRTLVEGHGGTIEVESEVGKGSTFTVRLPIGRGPALPVRSAVEGSEAEGEEK